MAESFRNLHQDVPAFTTYFITAVMARMAYEGLKLALILAAADTAAGIKLGALLVAAFLVPSTLAAPFVGRMADMSKDPTRLYSLAFAFNGFMIAICGLTLETLPPAVILLLAATGGTVGPLIMGGFTSLISTFVPARHVHRAYGLNAVTYNVSAILAPAVVAAVAGWISPLVSLLVLAGLMVIAALLVLRLPIASGNDRATIAAPSPIDGFRATAMVTPLRTTAVTTSLQAVSLGILPVVATLMAKGTFNVNAGVMLSTVAAGALVGSLAYAAVPVGINKAHVLLPIVIGTTAIPLAALSLVSYTPIALMLFAMNGLLSGPQGSAQTSIRDRFSPPNVRTQVFTLGTSLRTTFSAFGAALAGLMSGASPQLLLVIAAACTVLGTTWALLDLYKHGWFNRDARHDALTSY